MPRPIEPAPPVPAPGNPLVQSIERMTSEDDAFYGELLSMDAKDAIIVEALARVPGIEAAFLDEDVLKTTLHLIVCEYPTAFQNAVKFAEARILSRCPDLVLDVRIWVSEADVEAACAIVPGRRLQLRP